MMRPCAILVVFLALCPLQFCGALRLNIEGIRLTPTPKQSSHETAAACLRRLPLDPVSPMLIVSGQPARHYYQQKDEQFEKSIWLRAPPAPLWVFVDDSWDEQLGKAAAFPPAEELPQRACTIDVFKAEPWLQMVNMNGSSLDEICRFQPWRCGSAHNEIEFYDAEGRALSRKAAAMRHAVHSTPDGTVVVWVDSDVLFVKPEVSEFYRFVRKFDLVYIPQPGEDATANMLANKPLDVYNGMWFPETGVFSFTANNSTRAFLDEARDMYNGLLLHTIKECYCEGCSSFTTEGRTGELCNWPESEYFSTSDDIHVFGRLLFTHMHKEKLTEKSDLKQGWFVNACDGAPTGSKTAQDEGVKLAHSTSCKQQLPLDANCVPTQPVPSFISPFNLHSFFHHFIDGSGVLDR